MKAFVSYSHHDAWALERLNTHIAMLRRDKLIEAWSDLEIKPGEEIDRKVADTLAACDLFIPLVSPDFLASFYCYDRELAAATERYERGEIQIVPVVVEPCDWKGSPLKRFKMLPKDGKPISDFTNKNTAFLDVSMGLRTICEAGLPKPTVSSAAPPSVSKQEAPSRKYRMKKTFDAIDRSDFIEAGFAEFKAYFKSAVAELNDIEGLKGRFRNMSDRTFTCTITNAHHRRGTADLTVHNGTGGSMMGDIYYSWAANAAENGSNGSFSVENDEYELFWTDRDFSRGGRDSEPLTARSSAERLWDRFIEKAGISYAGEDQD